MINYDSPRELRAFLDERSLGMRKKLGQNFLINSAVRSKLLDALELPRGSVVWEIGPGLGAMTAGLLERGGHVTAFEVDPAFARALRELFVNEISSGGPLRLVEGDVFKTWPQVNLHEQPNSGEIFLLGNLPYNIAAALIADFIEKGKFFKRMVVTVQHEVARRMAAKPGSADYSSFSVLCSSVYSITPLNIIKPSSFYPAPRVDSQGVRMDFEVRSRKFPDFFYPMVRNLFSSRRKTIRNTLSRFVSSAIMNKDCTAQEAAAEVFKKTGISGDRRPETLSIDEFAALAELLKEIVHG